MIMVNGNTWPFSMSSSAAIAPLLNGCDARVLILDFSNIPGVEVWMIGNEGGSWHAVNLTTGTVTRCCWARPSGPEWIVDFTNVPLGDHVPRQCRPRSPFTGLPVDPAEVADPIPPARLLQFRVGRR